ncbi:MAG TPA: hypothetical protein VHE81_06570 [Lacipirellulaceae bacterium]|nr:hypothetical protein [Lacipirellulaceae bacterium]
MGQPIVVTVALADLDADGISTSQTIPAAGALAINGALSAGAVANNICASQSKGAAGALTINGSAASSGVAYIYGKPVTITSAADDSDITFTVSGLGVDGYSFASETVTGANASVVATQTLFHQVTSVTVSAATSGNVTVGTNGIAQIADLGTARQVSIASAGDDSGITFTITGTNAGGNPLVETVTGAVTDAATTVNHFQSVSQITASGASDDAVTVGTNGVGSSGFVSLNYHAQPVNISVASVVSGTISYTVQWTYDDPNKVTPTWFDDGTAKTKTDDFVTTMNDPVFGSRVLINSETAPASVTTTYIQAGLVGC